MGDSHKRVKLFQEKEEKEKEVEDKEKRINQNIDEIRSLHNVESSTGSKGALIGLSVATGIGAVALAPFTFGASLVNLGGACAASAYGASTVGNEKQEAEAKMDKLAVENSAILSDVTKLKHEIEEIDKELQKENVGLLNARSVNTSTAEIFSLLEREKPNMFAITEAWHLTKKTKDDLEAFFEQHDYKYDYRPRCQEIQYPDGTCKRRSGGGILFIWKRCYTCVCEKTYDRYAYEAGIYRLSQQGKKDIHAMVVYAPKPKSVNNKDHLDFCPIKRLKNQEDVDDFFLNFLDAMVDMVDEKRPRLLLMGDFNYHLGKNEKNADEFIESLESLGIFNKVVEPTHRSGNVLDLVAVRDSFIDIEDIELEDVDTSDHKAIFFNIIRKR